VGEVPAIRRSASAQNKQDQSEKDKSNLDVLAIDLLRKDKKFAELVFHWAPLSIRMWLNLTPGQAPKEASKQTGIIKKNSPNGAIVLRSNAVQAIKRWYKASVSSEGRMSKSACNAERQA